VVVLQYLPLARYFAIFILFNMRIKNKYANEAETSLKLFRAVSVFCFSFFRMCDALYAIYRPKDARKL